jgi:hypothetical protein
MRLYVDTMDAVLVGIDDAGRVRFENEEWTTPTLQETRAILHAARTTIDELTELIDTVERAAQRG